MAIYPENADYDYIDKLETDIFWERLEEPEASGRLDHDYPAIDLWLFQAFEKIGIDNDTLFGGTHDIIYFYDAETGGSLFHTPYRQEIRY